MLFFVIRRGKTTIKTETVKRKSLFWLRVKSKLKGQVEIAVFVHFVVLFFLFF